MYLAVLIVFFVRFSLAAPVPNNATDAVTPVLNNETYVFIPVLKKETDAVKRNIKHLLAVLTDDSKTPTEKQAAFLFFINNLPKSYENLYNNIMEKVETAVQKVPVGSSAATFQALLFIDASKTGLLFTYSLDEVVDIFHSLKEDQMKELLTQLEPVVVEVQTSLKIFELASRQSISSSIPTNRTVNASLQSNRTVNCTLSGHLFG